MTTVLLGLGSWLAAIGFLCCLGRSAALGDAAELRPADRAELFRDRRTGQAERRTAARPWQGTSPGRRRDDALRAEREEADRARQGAEDDALLKALGY